MTNNYLRYGQHPEIHFLFFDSRNADDLERVRVFVHKLGPTTPAMALWRPCEGLRLPVVGEVQRTVWAHKAV